MQITNIVLVTAAIFGSGITAAPVSLVERSASYLPVISPGTLSNNSPLVEPTLICILAKRAVAGALEFVERQFNDPNIWWGSKEKRQFNDPNIWWGSKEKRQFNDPNIWWGSKEKRQFNDPNIWWGSKEKRQFNDPNIWWGAKPKRN